MQLYIDREEVAAGRVAGQRVQVEPLTHGQFPGDSRILYDPVHSPPHTRGGRFSVDLAFGLHTFSTMVCPPWRRWQAFLSAEAEGGVCHAETAVAFAAAQCADPGASGRRGVLPRVVQRRVRLQSGNRAEGDPV